MLFTTGLGTPTGNPVTPVVKIASNTALFERMRDIIDINTGGRCDRRKGDDCAGGGEDIGICDRGRERGDRGCVGAARAGRLYPLEAGGVKL